jgi:hypothetical protein
MQVENKFFLKNIHHKGKTNNCAMLHDALMMKRKHIIKRITT